VGWLCGWLMVSLVVLLGGWIGEGATGEPNCLSGGILAVGFGFVEGGGVGGGGAEVKDLRTLAANSARVAGMGPVPFGR
jgi:hypothetical protein